MQTPETERRPVERLPLSDMALCAWQYDLTPDQLDLIAESFRNTAAELRAIGMGKEVAHA